MGMEEICSRRHNSLLEHTFIGRWQRVASSKKQTRNQFEYKRVGAGNRGEYGAQSMGDTLPVDRVCRVCDDSLSNIHIGKNLGGKCPRSQ
jgi:hypothetical protein